MIRVAALAAVFILGLLVWIVVGHAVLGLFVQLTNS